MWVPSAVPSSLGIAVEQHQQDSNHLSQQAWTNLGGPGSSVFYHPFTAGATSSHHHASTSIFQLKPQSVGMSLGSPLRHAVEPQPRVTPSLLVGPLGIDMAPALYGTASNHRPAPMHVLLPCPSYQPGVKSRIGTVNENGATISARMTSPSPPTTSQQHSEQQQSQQQSQDYHQLHQSQQGLRKQRASSSSVQMNKEIMASSSISQLLSLVRSRGHLMDYFNLSSAITRTPKLAGLSGDASTPHHAPLNRDTQELAGHLAHLMCKNIHQFDARGNIGVCPRNLITVLIFL